MRSVLSPRACALLALCAAACGDGHSYVQVTITSSAMITVSRLEVALGNAGMSASTTVDKGAPFTLPPDQTFALQVDGRSGELTIAVDAVRPDGPTLHAADKVPIVAGGTARLTLPLTTATDDGGANDLAGSCTDHAQNGDETGIDCGGSCPTKCAEGSGCAVAADCTSGFCNTATSKCGPARCISTLKDGDETDVDCGGASCLPCEPDKLCVQSSDCATGTCTDGYCALASGPPSWLAIDSTAISSQTLAGAVGSDGKVYLVQQFSTPAGGFLSAPVNVYDPSTNMFTNLTTLPTIRAGVGATFGKNGLLYVLGGQKYAGPLNVVEAYQPDTWTTPKAMSSARGFVASVTGPDGRIYAIGGTSDGTNALFTAEAYTPSSDSWVQAGQLTAREQLAAAVGLDGAIYAIGGKEAPTAVEQWQADGVEFWKHLSPLKTGRYLLGAATGADGRVYALGGTDGTTVLSSVEAYAPKSNKWLAAPPLAFPRVNFVAARLLDGHLIAIGGSADGGAAYIPKIELYGPKVNLSSTSGAVGTTVLVGGGNFAAGAKVTVTFDGVPVAAGTTDPTGALAAPISFGVPASAAGAHMVKVVDDRSRYPITLQFTVM
jgi:hypothetical protein